MTLVLTCRLSQLNLPTQLLEAQSFVLREVCEGFVLFFFLFWIQALLFFHRLASTTASTTFVQALPTVILVENLLSLWSLSAEPIYSALKAQSLVSCEVREAFILFFGSKLYSSSIGWPLQQPPLGLCKPWWLWYLVKILVENLFSVLPKHFCRWCK